MHGSLFVDELYIIPNYSENVLQVQYRMITIKVLLTVFTDQEKGNGILGTWF